MGWRCVKDLRYYCKDTPVWSKEPVEVRTAESEDTTSFFTQGECSLEPTTCGKCQSMLDQMTPEHREEVLHPNYVVVDEENQGAEKKSTSKTVKSKEAKKSEKGAEQRRMF